MPLSPNKPPGNNTYGPPTAPWRSNLRGILTALLIGLNTLFFCLPLYVVAVIRLVAGADARSRYTRWMNTVAEAWIDTNNFIIDRTQTLTVDATLPEDLSRDRWYLVFSNHQSWTDILILQRVFRHKIPMLKFFIKRILVWVPVIGLAWWLLDFPVMRRYTRELLNRRPELAGKDLASTRRSSQKFGLTPVSVLNFLEGTRFTAAKHDAQQSPYDHLLKPKSGGAALVINTLGQRIDSLIDVTIIYSGPFGFWDFLCGRTHHVQLTARTLPVPVDFEAGNYEQDPEFKATFQEWVSDIWSDKDQALRTSVRREQ